MKNNKIVHEALIKQVDMMFPAEMKEPVKVTIEKCKGVCELCYLYSFTYTQTQIVQWSESTDFGLVSPSLHPCIIQILIVAAKVWSDHFPPLFPFFFKVLIYRLKIKAEVTRIKGNV